MPPTTTLSKEKGSKPTKKDKKKSSTPPADYFPAPSGGGGWPSRHDRTAAPVDTEATAEAAEATRGRKAKPTIWDLSLTPPKWAPPALVAGKASPATAAALEVHAAKALRRLRLRLAALCTERGMKAKLRKLTLERWRFAAKREEEAAAAAQTGGDKSSKKRKSADAAPVLHPLIPTSAPAAEAELTVELTRQGLLRSDAQSAAAALTQASAAQAARLIKLSHAAASGRPLAPPPVTLKFNRHTIDMISGKTQVKLSRQAYSKLAHFHRCAMPSEGAPKPQQPAAKEGGDEGEGGRPTYELESRAAEEALATATDTAVDDPRAALHLRLFAVLLRYKSIQGHGFQAAIGPPVWRCVVKSLGVGVEGFGSPLNAYLPAFGSAFADIDGPFGSRGSFFGMRPMSGSFAANPPFVHNVMTSTAEHIHSLLTTASEQAVGSHALSFVVFLPGWQEGGGYQQLSASPFLRRRVLIAAADHGYCDGAAHQRQDPYRYSPYDTAVFVLQTDKASRKWPADDKFERELRKAFAECVPSENAVQRQGKATKGGGVKRAAAPSDNKGGGEKKQRKNGGVDKNKLGVRKPKSEGGESTEA